MLIERGTSPGSSEVRGVVLNKQRESCTEGLRKADYSDRDIQSLTASIVKIVDSDFALSKDEGGETGQLRLLQQLDDRDELINRSYRARHLLAGIP